MSNLNTRRRLAAAFAIGAVIGFVPMLSSAAGAAQPKPPGNSGSSFPGGCIDYWTGSDHANGAYRVDSKGTVWKCVNGQWHTTVSRTGGADRASGGATVAQPPRG